MGMIKKQYGKSIMIDEVNKLIQESLNKYLTEEKVRDLRKSNSKNARRF